MADTLACELAGPPPEARCATRTCRADAEVRMLVPAGRSADGFTCRVHPETWDLCGRDYSRAREMLARGGDPVADTTGTLEGLREEFPGWHIVLTDGWKLVAAAELGGSGCVTVGAYLAAALRAEMVRAMDATDACTCIRGNDAACVESSVMDCPAVRGLADMSPPQVKTCRTCGGTWNRRGGDDPGRPCGWYSLSVNVPPHLGKRSQPFVWVGVYCSAVCLIAGAADIQRQEMLARLAYEADPPDPPVPAVIGRPACGDAR